MISSKPSILAIGVLFRERRKVRASSLLVLLGLLLNEGLLVTTLAGGGEGGTGETTAGGVHALDGVALLNFGHGGSLVAAVDTGGCGLLDCVSLMYI